MQELIELIKVIDTTSSDVLLFALIIASVIGLVRYIKMNKQEVRKDFKDLHKNYRTDICELMNRCRDERAEQRASLEKISLESNKVMTKLTMTVAELKVMVDSKMR
tara:strand:+ start:1939 stop:2256 length:318 start_codon:yes stop_codon:yes gene_type:complete